ncbi:MAG: hypothetical protein GEU83_04230 [Pseudonocardiaceae bacterium]|nr:hypothetical protein [Pseudonocardiaceae bacterium]
MSRPGRLDGSGLVGLGSATDGAVERAGAHSAGLSRQNTIYRRVIALCDQLADAALRGADPLELTRVFADLVGKRIVLLDPALAVRAQSGGDPQLPAPDWDRSDERVSRLLHTLEAERRPLRVPPVPGSAFETGWLIAPIAVGERTLGFLLVPDGPGAREPDDVDLLTTTYAATLFALTLANERTSTELGMRYQRAVVDALVSGHFLDTEDAHKKLRSLGLRGTFRVAAVRLAGGAADGEQLVDRLTASVPGSVVMLRDATVIALLPDPPAPGPGMTPGGALTELLRGCAAGATSGLSDVLAEPERAPDGLHEAEQAIDLGIRLGWAGTVVRWDQLGIYRLLLTMGDMSALRRFAGDILGLLVDYDRGHRSDLVATLSAFLRHHGSRKQAARTLRLHVNTVAYRMQRIEQITGLDLTDPDDRLVAHVAVKIIESQRGAVTS